MELHLNLDIQLISSVGAVGDGRGIFLGATFDLAGLAGRVLVVRMNRHESGLDLGGLGAVGVADLLFLVLPLAADHLGCQKVSLYCRGNVGNVYVLEES